MKYAPFFHNPYCKRDIDVDNNRLAKYLNRNPIFYCQLICPHYNCQQQAPPEPEYTLQKEENKTMILNTENGDYLITQYIKHQTRIRCGNVKQELTI